jgi:hypothetical protein
MGPPKTSLYPKPDKRIQVSEWIITIIHLGTQLKTGEIKDMSNSPSKGAALITGASRGIGTVYADRLAKRGYDLILVARSEAPLKALTASLASASGRHVTSIVADLNNKIALAKVETRLRDDPSITLLVNNAGFASVATLLNADMPEPAHAKFEDAQLGRGPGNSVVLVITQHNLPEPRTDFGHAILHPASKLSLDGSELRDYSLLRSDKAIIEKYPKLDHKQRVNHLGTLGTGNHFNRSLPR